MDIYLCVVCKQFLTCDTKVRGCFLEGWPVRRPVQALGLRVFETAEVHPAQGFSREGPLIAEQGQALQEPHVDAAAVRRSPVAALLAAQAALPALLVAPFLRQPPLLQDETHRLLRVPRAAAQAPRRLHSNMPDGDVAAGKTLAASSLPLKSCYGWDS